VERYALAALDRERGRVRDAGSGAHNDALNRAAFNLGQLVHQNLLGEAQVRDALRDAVAALDCPRCSLRQADATISAALVAAQRKPRSPRRDPRQPQRQAQRQTQRPAGAA